MITISEDRMKHTMAVARKMRELAISEPERYPVEPDDAFTVGFLHDIGYEFVEKQVDHSAKGGILLRDQGFKYWREVYYHGIPQTEFDSPMLRLLNYADITTGPTGVYMTIEERLDDIKARYGEGSLQETETRKLAEMLEKQNKED